jgi:hypothetical protein
MPPRCLAALIVAGWLAATGWLFYREVWPWLIPGAVPPFTIDLEDGVQTQPAKLGWKVTYNDRECFRADTWVEPDADGETFALWAQLKPALGTVKQGGPQPLGGLVALHKSSSVYRVTRRGELRSLDVEIVADVQLFGLAAPCEAKLTGDVRNGLFCSHLKVHSSLGDFDEELPAVPSPSDGSVLSPLHPVKRISGLRPGQAWRQPLVDPLKTAFIALARKYLRDVADEYLQDETVVSARVLPDRQTLLWNHRPVECLVIEYAGERVSAHTWVEAESGLVLRQEADRDEEHWAMQRE